MNVSRCRSCHAEIVWLKTVGGKNMPIDADFMAKIGDLDDDAPEFNYADHADGVHWKSCPHADQHRRPR